MDIKQIVLDLCALSDEQEWFEFKENWFQPEALRQLLSMKLINDFEYEKIKKRLMRDYGVVSNITT